MAYDFSKMGPSASTFAGLGKGIGSGLAQNYENRRKRRLFDQLKQDYLGAKERQASMQVLATMGLNTEPIEGDSNYGKYANFMQQVMADPTARGNIGRSVMDIDQDMGMKYMLGEAKGVGGGASGKKEDDPQFLAMKTQLAKNISTTHNAVMMTGAALTKDPGNPDLQRNYYDAMSKYVEAKGTYAAQTGSPPSFADSASQISTNLKLPTEVKNVAGQIDARVNTAINAASAPIKDVNKRLMDSVAAFKKKFDLIRQYLVGVGYYSENFEKLKNDPDALAGITKHLGQIIEPGLQVTEGEVSMFQGNNSVTKVIQLGAQSLDALKAAFTADQKALAEAGTDNPGVFWKILTQAENLAARSLGYFKDAVTQIKPEFVEKARREAKLFVEGNALLPDDKKALLIDKANKVGSELDYIINAEIPTPTAPGTPMPDTEEEGEAADIEGDLPPPEGLDITGPVQKVLGDAAKQSAGNMVGIKVNPAEIDLDAHYAKNPQRH